MKSDFYDFLQKIFHDISNVTFFEVSSHEEYLEKIENYGQILDLFACLKEDSQDFHVICNFKI